MHHQLRLGVTALTVAAILAAGAGATTHLGVSNPKCKLAQKVGAQKAKCVYQKDWVRIPSKGSPGS